MAMPKQTRSEPPAGRSPSNREPRFDDPEFPARIRASDPTALTVVVRTYLPQILRAARGAGLGRHESEDVAQATFTTFVEAAPRFEGRSHIRTWLFGILYRKIAEQRRHLQRDGSMDDIDEIFGSRFDARGSWSRPPAPADSELRRPNGHDRERHAPDPQSGTGADPGTGRVDSVSLSRQRHEGG